LKVSTVLLANPYIHIVMGSLLFFTSIFMIFLILIQRGRGGGLAGALGGSGGSSAFGAKAGDTFTRVTAAMAIFWFVLCLLTILMIQGPRVAPVADREPGLSGGSSAATTTDSDPSPPATTEAPIGKSIEDLLKDIAPLELEDNPPAADSGSSETTGSETTGSETTGSETTGSESAGGEGSGG